ncbi:DUF2779 domain-containing protein [Roseibacillus persicicus]|uniref:DUF2779 domain-containing protein n=1 Tax=Roseibacillus persicicus TaxID=454148 RepID=UPI0028108553|nr:DUF2779 domain-containing protein [Roseibacillus persicicus]MDQ8192518.1 DUF2779 domain-containing protein [Roseibacillus persicicus]
MRQLSKSKIIAFRQCPKRLWLELHRPDLRDDSGSEFAFAVGNQVGDIARSIYDPEQKGHLIDINEVGWDTAFSATTDWLADQDSPLFEAALRIPGALALADVMLPQRSDNDLHWHMIEVKSSTQVKDYHHDDIAVQAYVAQASGLPLTKVALAHVDNTFVYPGGGDYQGLLTEVDMTEEAFSRTEEVAGWLTEAQAIAALPDEPSIEPGPQCHQPFRCSFCAHCIPEKELSDYPLTSFYRLRTAGIERLEAAGYQDVRDVPADQLSYINQRIREHTISGEPYFDQEGAAADLAQFPGEPRFLDFETIGFAVPIWAGTRPYQQIPFQFSLHHLDKEGKIQHHEFLDTSGSDPRLAMIRALIDSCGDSHDHGPIFAYNAPFEKRVIADLIAAFPVEAVALTSILERIEDLLPIARARYYHPSQHGSWSIKAVLPALCPELSYSDLDEVQNGELAQQAYLEAIAPETQEPRRQTIHHQLLKYCELDTFGLVKMWQFFLKASQQAHT